MENRKRIIVIGGGVAGLMAALTAREHGADVMLLEKMDRVGLKMGITGKGRCNLTNMAPIGDFIPKTPGNGKFLFSAYKKFSNLDLLNLLHQWGLKTKVERGGRVFPASEDAQEVRHLFMRRLKKEEVHVHFNEPARHIIVRDGRAAGVETALSRYPADAVILCTGGKSYPRTGSTGDGYRMAEEVGHTVTPLRPSLIPLVCSDKYVGELEGLLLKNVRLTLYCSKKKKASEFGEMMFTSYGISGAITLRLSDWASLWLSEGEDVKGFIDLKPALSEAVLDQRILRDFKKYHTRQMEGALADLLPHKMILPVLKLAGINPKQPVSELHKEKRLALVKIVKALPLTVTGTRPIEEAIVTAGGVAVREIQSSTMESKIIKGLYLAGEVIDIHAFTGGYNLQAAFSTGRLAAVSAAGGANEQ